MNLNCTDEISFNKTFTHEDTLWLSNVTFKVNLALIVIGIFDNLCCIYVFLQKSMRKRQFNWYLLVLAIIELVFCLILMVDYLFRLFNTEPKFLHDLNVYTYTAIDFSLHIIDSFVTVLTLILSFDRLYAIRHRTEIKKFVALFHKKLLLIVILITLFMLKLPSLLTCYKNEKCQKSENKFKIAFCTLISPLLVNIIPAVVIVAVNILVVVEMIKYYKNLSEERRNLMAFRRSRRSTELNINVCRRNTQAQLVVYTRRLTLRPLCRTQKSHFFLIIVLAMWLVLTIIPYYTLHIFEQLFSGDKAQIYKALIISSIFFNSNHCINFFIYFFFNFEFRKCFLKLFNYVKEVN
jgi:hypothetical protein